MTTVGQKESKSAAPRHRARRMFEWALWFMATPLSSFWLIIGIMALAAVVELFRVPRHGLELVGGVSILIGLVNLVARAKGISAWPRSID
jgi:hypothetical protein